MYNRPKGRMTMAQAALHVCNKYGCHRLTHDTYCELHQHLKRQYDDHRESASKRGYNGRWRKASKTYLLSHPFCIRCLQQGRYEKATVVDHITPHKEINSCSGTGTTGNHCASNAMTVRQRQKTAVLVDNIKKFFLS